VIGKQERWQEDLFVAGPLSSLVPESALRLMLAGFFEGITHDRKLMRTARVNLAMRWFTGYRLHESENGWRLFYGVFCGLQTQFLR
jgi:transposase